MDSEDTTVAGSLAERFRFALSYAAAGHILGWGPVVQRGCEIAAQLLDATTVEKALEFALEGYCDKGAYEEFKYGNGSRALLHATVIFIVNNLHPLFNLDNLVTIDPGTYARLPFDSTSAPKAVESPVDSPVIARGSSVAHLAKGVHPRSHRSIQFGDLMSLAASHLILSEVMMAIDKLRMLSSLACCSTFHLIPQDAN
ncbi:unnamed protein product [Clonostachys rosea f. rosea IK726]|uniref:Uncharacterized protein n=1 Tax=Clonostachys rosea f. rosea IK726 TaxID=1349383 RepID=A0ACA9UQG6_BIOOC|nr:unnamed protein product [Clonostachys rosea f. rosea IK726]